MQENKCRNLDYFSQSYNLYYKNAFCLTNCKENRISLDKFKMFDKKQKRNVFIFFEMLTKCINFAAENEHNVKERLDLNSKPMKVRFRKETINRSINTLLIIKGL